MKPDNCTACGDCCRYLIIPLPRFKGHAAEKDHDKWIGFHEVNINGTVISCTVVNVPGGKGVRVNIPCRYLDGEGHCMVYEARPVMCRKGKCIK